MCGTLLDKVLFVPILLCRYLTHEHQVNIPKTHGEATKNHPIAPDPERLIIRGAAIPFSSGALSTTKTLHPLLYTRTIQANTRFRDLGTYDMHLGALASLFTITA